MTTRTATATIASALVLLGCRPDGSTTPAAPRTPLFAAAGLIGSFDLPIQFPTGLASDGGMLLYLSTGSGFRETHRIHRVLQADIGTIPTGGNPRDVTFDGTNLFFSDLSNVVVERTVLGTFVNSLPLPFRGGGIANNSDTIWVGNVDANQLFMTIGFGAYTTTFPSAVRIEGLVFDPSSYTLWAITPFAGDHKLYELTTTGALIRSCESDYEPGLYGLGGIALVADTFYIAEPKGGDPTAGTTILIVDKTKLVCTAPPVKTVRIRISPATINPNSNGVVKVTILTDNGFNAATVDAASVHFGHSGVEASPINVTMQDVGNDGDLDMVLTFLRQDTGIVCGDQTVLLTGKTIGGQAIQGSDAIRTVGGGCHP